MEKAIEWWYSLSDETQMELAIQTKNITNISNLSNKDIEDIYITIN
jgi:hypothetical protein